jgi:hypothetical protein
MSHFKLGGGDDELEELGPVKGCEGGEAAVYRNILWRHQVRAVAIV